MTEESKKTAKLIQWFVVHSWVVALVYFGLLAQHPWATNATKFTVWILYAPFVLFTFLAPNEMKEQIKKEREKRPLPVPPWVTWLIDMCMAVFLAVNQMWFYAGVVGIAGVVSFAMNLDDDAPEAPAQDPRPLGPDYFSEGETTNGKREDREPGPPRWHV